MSILREQLLALDSSVGADIAAALAPYTGTGAFAGLLDGPTTTVPEGGLVVLSLRELPEELKTIGTLLALDITARRVANPATRRPRQVTVDEAWLLMRQPIGAEFLLKAAKSFRKSWAGLTVATQDCADVLSTDIGKAIVANSATQILLRQASQVIDEVAAAFKLSDGERTMLLTAGRGVGLLSTGTHRAAFATLASAVENELITSDPNEIAATEAGVDESDYVTLSDNVIDDSDTREVLPTEPDDGPDGEGLFIDLRDAA
ncbi:VirB4 family type IV secretion system protein [Nocardia salmonicida]|uniref:VirB4 family type IV secretion system protein n=1 Tax=Nocardia salmonicida TaxID=53431 RepID=UPI003CF8091D